MLYAAGSNTWTLYQWTQHHAKLDKPESYLVSLVLMNVCMAVWMTLFYGMERMHKNERKVRDALMEKAEQSVIQLHIDNQSQLHLIQSMTNQIKRMGGSPETHDEIGPIDLPEVPPDLKDYLKKTLR